MLLLKGVIGQPRLAPDKVLSLSEWGYDSEETAKNCEETTTHTEISGACYLCNDNGLGDEYHLVFKCKGKNDNDGEKYLLKYYLNLPSMFTFILSLQLD